MRWHCLVVQGAGAADWRIVEAGSEEAALARLDAEGVVALEIRRSSASLFDRLGQPILQQRLGASDQALLLTQLATLVRAALPVDRSLDLLREQATRATQRTILTRMVAMVRAGGGLTRAFEETSSFPAYVTGVIRAAERGGGLGAALATIAERLSLTAATRRQLVTALSYPAAILFATVAALIIVLTLVVPQFAPIFAGQEEKLPLLTQVVLWLSERINTAPFVSLSLLLLPILAIIAFLRSTLGQALVEEHGHRLPLLGLRDQYLAAQFTGILATLLGNGVKIVDALPLVRDAMGSARWRRHADAVERRIREGFSLSFALTRDGLLPITAIRLIEVGEHSGTLVATCAQASAVLGDAARARIDRIVSVANPVAIIILGGLVAALVGGVMLGIFALGDFAG